MLLLNNKSNNEFDANITQIKIDLETVIQSFFGKFIYCMNEIDIKLHEPVFPIIVAAAIFIEKN